MWNEEANDGNRSNINNFMSSLHEIIPPVNTILKKQVLSDYMFVQGKIINGEGLTVATEEIMFDTGALQSSFIDQALVDKTEYLKALIQPCKHIVTLGDGKECKVKATHSVTTNLIYQMHKEKSIL